MFSFTLQTGNLSGDASCGGKKKNLKRTRCSRTDIGVRIKKWGAEVCACLGLGFFSDRLTFTMLGKEAAGKDQSSKRALDLDGLLNALTACSKVQWIAAGVPLQVG